MVFFTLGLTALSSGLPASAITLTTSDIDTTFNVEWFLEAGGSDNDGGVTAPIDLSADASFTLRNFEENLNNSTEDRITLEVVFNNSTQLLGATTEAGITSFGFGVTPDAVGVTFSDSQDNDGFTAAEIIQNGQQNFPGGFKQIDVCVFTTGCSGGSQGSALAAGTSDNFLLAVTGDFNSGVTLSPFPVKFQTSQGSFEFAGTENNIAEIPEPGMVIALGLFTIGSLMTSKNKK